MDAVLSQGIHDTVDILSVTPTFSGHRNGDHRAALSRTHTPKQYPRFTLMGGLIIKRDMTSVREQLTLKQDEFQSLVAKRLGMGDLKDLSPANLRRAEELAEKYLDIWEEADRQGDPLAQVDDALATLAREYHDLKKQFADTPSSPEDTPSSSDGGLEEKDQLQPP